MHGTLNVRSTYKTSAALGLSQEEFDALAWFVEQYDSGVVTDGEVILRRIASPCLFLGKLDKFNMKTIGQTMPCGTVGCILGWIAHRVVDDVHHTWPDEIERLFYFYHEGAKAAEARDATVRVLRGEQAWPRGEQVWPR